MLILCFDRLIYLFILQLLGNERVAMKRMLKKILMMSALYVFLGLMVTGCKSGKGDAKGFSVLLAGAVPEDAGPTAWVVVWHEEGVIESSGSGIAEQFTILTATFNSFTTPFIIMIAIPFGFIGVMLTLFVHGLPISFPAFMGFVALSGVVVNDSLIIIDFVKSCGGTPEAGVIAGGFKTSPFMAALANGTMGHGLDYDDECESWVSHPTVSILPAIFALGEKRGTSGRTVITAYILGWEVASRIGRNTYFKMTQHGWHATPVVGTLSGTMAAAKVLDFDVETITRALGIAASQVGGLVANFGTDTEPLHAGLAASNAGY